MGKFLVKKWIVLIIPVLILLMPQMVRAEEMPLRSGDRVVLAAKDADYALSDETEAKGLSGVEFSPEQPELAAVWTLQQQDDGSWVLESAEGRLSMDPECELLPVKWTVK